MPLRWRKIFWCLWKKLCQNVHISFIENTSFLYYFPLLFVSISGGKELLFVMLLYIKNSSYICNFNTLSNCIVYWADYFVQSNANPSGFAWSPLMWKLQKQSQLIDPSSDSPVICYMSYVIYHMLSQAYSCYCSLSYCSHPTSSSAMSVHPDFWHSLNAPLPVSPTCPSLCPIPDV